MGFRLSQAPRLIAVRKEEEGRQERPGGRQEGGGALKRKYEEGVEEQEGKERAHRRWTKGYDMPLPQVRILTQAMVQTVESPKGLSGKICAREVPRVIRLSQGAQPRGKV